MQTRLFTSVTKNMKSIMKTNIYPSMAAMFLAAVLAGSALAENQVPFTGSLEGVVSITPIDAQSSFVRINGTGNASHLGLFTVDIPHIVNRQARTGIGTYTFTAANGDTLNAEFAGLATPTAIPTVLSIVEIGSITGGTGRFADAIGRFIVTRSFDVVTGLTTGSFEGTISSPGASKP